jgi:hypothetical protein
VHGAGEAVQRFRPIEPEGAHTALMADKHQLFFHRAAPASPAKKTNPTDR